MQVVEGDIEKELSGELQCKVCEKSFLQSEMETHLRFSHGVMPANKKGMSIMLNTGAGGGIIEGPPQFPGMSGGLAGPGGAMASAPSVSSGAPGGAVNTVPGADLALAELLKTLTPQPSELLKTLTPQPDYLLRCLTPVPLETLDDYIGGQ